MNPVSDTAYLTCGARADDAAKAKPVCGDRYAARFLAGSGEAIYRQFKEEARPIASIVVRHRLIDDLLRERIAGNPETAVVIIGAGFDSRAFRIPGGRWFEIDEPQVIELKNNVLPTRECANPLRRIAIDFSSEALIDKLPRFAAASPVVVVMEGIFIYLDDKERNATLEALRLAYPRHSLICDLNTRTFMQRYGKSLIQRIEALGARLQFMPEKPSADFIASGYIVEVRYSIIEKLLGFAENWYAALASWFLPKVMREGLTLNVFRLVPPSSEVKPGLVDVQHR